MRTTDITLTDFISTLKGVQKTDDNNYRFIYNYCWCNGVVLQNISGSEEILKITPMNKLHSIGNGEGKGVTIKFKT